METLKTTIAELKSILEHVQAPAELDLHPWTKSLWVQQFAFEQPGLNSHSAGYRLLAALSALFRETMPGTPPRQGKRIDTRWGQFGIVGALYFAPFEFGTLRPPSLLDAWGRIDEVILAYITPRSGENLPADEINRYRLVGDEFQAGPVSTISDWHVRGLEHLAESLHDRERLLSAQFARDSIVLDPQATNIVLEANSAPIANSPSPVKAFYRQHTRQIWLSLLFALALFFTWQGLRTWQLYRAFKTDVDQLQGFLESQPSGEMLGEVGSLVRQTRKDVVALQRQIWPYRWGGRLLAWLPVYGGDLAAAGDLIDFAAGLAVAADEGWQAAAPMLLGLQDAEQSLAITDALAGLSAAQPQFEAAQAAVQRALIARSVIDVNTLSPKTRPLFENVDPYLPLLEDGVNALSAVPKLLGAVPYGPQTYLILIQNEDEIRATGGFIAAAAIVTVEDGKIIAFKVEDSYVYDDLTRQYPAPPWQMQEYIRAWMFTFRNANWSPDFPTTALWAEYLYTYSSAHSVDGVFAIDQYLLQLILQALGPVTLDDADRPVTAENVIEFMRASKSEYGGDDPERKSFMGTIAKEIITKLQNDSDLPWQALSQAVLQALNERHILLQFDDPAVSALIAQQGWDGAMHAGAGDYLMVVDSNLGWNKVNAVTESAIDYSVDLSYLDAPQASLTLTHDNSAVGKEPCIHSSYGSGEYSELINRCYWNYLRVYTLATTQFVAARVHMVPFNWFIREKMVPARVDMLDNQGVVDENPTGLQAYGTMLVVPIGEERTTRFEFSLPAETVLVQRADGAWVYQLRVQKQAGTLGVPLTLHVTLQNGAEFVSAQPEGIFQDGRWQSEIALWTDVDIQLVFRIP